MKKLLLLITLLSSLVVIKAQNAINDWVLEDQSGKVEIKTIKDSLEVISPMGLTMWYNTRLTGTYEITYNIKMVMEGGQYDRLSDMNCFWAANDPANPDNLYARGKWRDGVFKNYNTLNLFYVGYGGNYNKTTRFRQYLGEQSEEGADVSKPIIKEYSDGNHLLKPNKWYAVRITVEKDSTKYYVDNEELFSLDIEEGKGAGHFAIRLLENHILLYDFKVTKTR